jgi:nucleotide-binding universal stress UspA family protein
LRAFKKDESLKILLAVDFSHSAAAVSMLTHITWPAETSVHLLTTVPDKLPVMEPSPETQRNLNETVEINRWRDWAAAKLFITQTTADLQAHHLTVEKTEICEGKLAEITPERAMALSVDLIVVGAEDIAKTGEIWPNSTTYNLAQYGQRSVLVVRPSEQVRPLTTILAVDDSPDAWRAVDFICTLCLPDWAKVTVVNVAEEAAHCIVGAAPAGLYPRTVDPWQPESETAEAFVDKVTGHLQGCGVQVRHGMRFGNAADEILSAAHEQDAALIIVGARSQTQASAFGLGGVSQTIIKQAPCSVLVVQ